MCTWISIPYEVAEGRGHGGWRKWHGGAWGVMGQGLGIVGGGGVEQLLWACAGALFS